MQNYVIQQTLFEEFNTIGDWTISTGTGQVVGNGLELISGSGTNCFATKTISQVFNGNMKIGFYIADTAALANIDAIEIYISSSTSFANYFKFSNFSSNFHEGYNEILINQTVWTNTNGESWANTMVRLRVRVNAKASVVAILRFDDLYIDYYSRPKCIFHFDDGYDTVYTTAYPLLRKFGFKGVVPINSDLVGTTGYMTRAQLAELYNAGWDLLNHTATHPHLDEESASDIRSELESCNDYLVNGGFTRNDMHKHFVYPYGDYNQTVIDQVKNFGFYTARSTLSNRTQAHSIGHKHLMLWQSVTVEDAAGAKEDLDRAIADGGLIIWGLHSIVDTPTLEYEWDTASFQELVEYVGRKTPQIDVVTHTEWYKGLSSSRKPA